MALPREVLICCSDKFDEWGGTITQASGSPHNLLRTVARWFEEVYVPQQHLQL